jgi:hypothetical protein
MATNIPRWMTQPTPSIGDASANRLRVVTPDDLQAASQMYGQLSQSMFEVARTNVYGLTYHRPDITAMKSYDKYQTAVSAMDKLRGHEKVKDGHSYGKLADPVIDDAVKDMGFLEGRIMKKSLIEHKYHNATHIDYDMSNQEIAQSRQFRQEEWVNKNKKFLSEVNPKWTPEEKDNFKVGVKQARRDSLRHITEDQHKIHDAEFDKDFEAAEAINGLFLNDNYKSTSERMAFLKSDNLQKVFSDPDLRERAFKILDNGTKLYNTKENIYDQVGEFYTQNLFIKFKNKHDEIQDPVKRKQFYNQAKKEAKQYDVKYMRKLKNFGSLESYEGNGGGMGSSGVRSSNDEMFRKGINGEMSSSEAYQLVSTRLMTRQQYSSFLAGDKLRKTEYGAADKDFESKVKAEFNISITPPKGRNAALVDEIVNKRANPEGAELKKFILEQKAALAAQGLKADVYQKGMQDIMILARQKKLEIQQKTQATYGSMSKEDKLFNDYAKR